MTTYAVTMPTGPVLKTGENRVVRGGNHFNKPKWLRSANRNHNHPGNRNNNIGFRLARAHCGRRPEVDQIRILSTLAWQKPRSPVCE